MSLCSSRKFSLQFHSIREPVEALPDCVLSANFWLCATGYQGARLTNKESGEPYSGCNRDTHGPAALGATECGSASRRCVWISWLSLGLAIARGYSAV